MIIDKQAFEACLAHMITCARSREEGVGLLSGPLAAPAVAAPGLISNVTVDEYSPLTNVAEFPQYRYEVDAGELLSAYNELEGGGYRPYIMVHSHLRGGAVPSDTDVRYATDPALLHLIVDVEPQRPHPALWRIGTESGFTKVRFQVADLRIQGTLPTDLTRRVTGG